MASRVFSSFLLLLVIEVSCGNTEEEFSFGQIRRDSSFLSESSVDKRHSFIGVTLNKAGIILSAHYVQPPPSVRLARAIGPIGGTTSTTTTPEPTSTTPAPEPPIPFKIKIHPLYEPDTYEKDIAVLVLEKPIDLIPGSTSVSLPPKNFSFKNANCFTYGQKINKNAAIGIFEASASKINVTIISAAACQSKLRLTPLGPNFKLAPKVVCGLLERDSISSFQLFCDGPNGKPILAGLPSWDINLNEKISVYTDVSKYTKWIRRQLNPNANQSSESCED